MTVVNNNPEKTLKAIEDIFGSEVKQYVFKKTTGGKSNQRGNAYEDIFAATQIARMAKIYLDTKENPYLASQVSGFVDDLVISHDLRPKQSSFQLKNTANVSWYGKKNSIEDDFLKQFQLSQYLGYKDIKLSLIVSDSNCVKRLTPPPNKIASFSTAEHFPYDDTVLKLLSRHEEIKSDFGFLARHEAFSTTDCEQVAQVLMGAWIANNRTGDVISLIDRARTVSPTIIRPLKTDHEATQTLKTETRNILDKLEGFSYSIERGFLRWSAFGTTGTLGYDCFDGRFSTFQDQLSARSPQTFDDIEGWLL